MTGRRKGREAAVVDRVNAKQLAEMLGVKPNAVAAAKKAGRIHCDPDGLYDAEIAIRDFNGSRQREPGPGRGHTFETPEEEAVFGATSCPTCGEIRNLQYWKTRAAREDFYTKRLQRQTVQGKLIDRTAAEDAQAALGAIMRTFLEGIGPSLRDDLAASDDPGECGELVAKAIRDALDRAANHVEEEADEDPGSEAEDE